VGESVDESACVSRLLKDRENLVKKFGQFATDPKIAGDTFREAATRTLSKEGTPRLNDGKNKSIQSVPTATPQGNDGNRLKSGSGH
jgi:hypothetical protein